MPVLFFVEIGLASRRPSVLFPRPILFARLPYDFDEHVDDSCRQAINTAHHGIPSPDPNDDSQTRKDGHTEAKRCNPCYHSVTPSRR